MYHSDIGKSTLNIWDEEHKERRIVEQSTQSKLAETANLLQALITKKSSHYNEPSKGDHHE